MPLARSKVTARGRISIPVEVRRKLGIEPGSLIEWYEDGGKMTVTRAGIYTSEDIHKRLFGSNPPPYHTLEELKQGIGDYMRRKHGRGKHRP